MNSLTFHLNALMTHGAIVVYGAVYLATVLLGNFSAFVIFWFAFAAQFPAWRIALLFIVILVALVTGDCGWYYAGMQLRGTRFGRWIKDHLPGHAKAEALIERRGRDVLYVSKFAYGSAAPVAFLLGWMGMDFGKFARNSSISIAISLPLLFGIVYGLFSSLSPLRAFAFFKHIEILFLIAVIVFAIFDLILIKALRAFFERRKIKE